ncbi:MAG TPA: hypothetical protein VJ868_09625, partial [Actinomycetota bacterium]|nr:hypothetical protein [Actinomycetota bacterium]
LRDRRFHYSAVVVVGPGPGDLSRALAESQPQAEIVEIGTRPDPDRVLELLEHAGIFPEISRTP